MTGPDAAPDSGRDGRRGIEPVIFLFPMFSITACIYIIAMYREMADAKKEQEGDAWKP